MDSWGFESRSELPGQMSSLLQDAGATASLQTQKAAVLWDSKGDGNFQTVKGAVIEVKPDGSASEDEITAARKAYETQTGKSGATVKLAWTEDDGQRSVLVQAAPAKKATERADERPAEPKKRTHGQKKEEAAIKAEGFAVVDAPNDSAPMSERDYSMYIREAKRMGLYGPSYSGTPFPARGPAQAPSDGMYSSQSFRPYAGDHRPAYGGIQQEPVSFQGRETAWLDLDGDGRGDREVPVLDVQLMKADGKLDDKEQTLIWESLGDAVANGVFGEFPPDTKPEDIYFAVRTADGDLVGMNLAKLGVKSNPEKGEAKKANKKIAKTEAKAADGQDKEVKAPKKLADDAVAARQAANASGRA